MFREEKQIMSSGKFIGLRGNHDVKSLQVGSSNNKKGARNALPRNVSACLNASIHNGFAYFFLGKMLGEETHHGLV